MNMKKLFTCLLLIASVNIISADIMWNDVQEKSIIIKGDRILSPVSYRTLSLNKHELLNLLSVTPKEEVVTAKFSKAIIALPMPNGTMQRFSLVESPVMEPALAAQFPEIRTYLGQGIDDPYSTVRLDYTPLGFHAMILSPFGTVFIDPYSMNETDYYISYYRNDYRCSVDKKFICQTETDVIQRNYNTPTISSTGEQLRTYRIAIAATGEYTLYFGGTVPAALAAITTSLNRITGVYETDLSVRMILIANETLIIYTDPNTDPYTNNSGSAMLTQNQANLDAVIGNANYDIGHVYSTGSFGGIAGLRVVCVTGQKARGATGSPAPIGDPWDIDYVAHEMGHQFGGNHTQNNINCNANPPTAWEPGSGITIMAYAGVCAPNLSNHSIPYFHGGNMFVEMIPYTQSGNGSTCPAATNTGNIPPAVTVPSGGFSIPISTPFSLTGSATDPNNDPLTYSWEEMDIGPQGNPSNPIGNAPIFRPFSPVTAGTRIFPKISDIINNTQTLGELLPTYSRNLTFKLTARDNRAGGGGVAYADIAFLVTNSAGPFLVTFPNTSGSYSGNQTVTWDVANTTAVPVSCNNVKISLSTDGGNTFPTILSSLTPNDGSQQITLPDINNSTARIKVEAADNIFFDMSNADFIITPIVGINNHSSTPVVFSLDQNFPNPFNPVTMINYSIPEKTHVTLNIYDVTGRLISTLINNEIKTEGYYHIEFNATNMPSGVYYCRLEAGNYQNVKKMILVK